MNHRFSIAKNLLERNFEAQLRGRTFPDEPFPDEPQRHPRNFGEGHSPTSHSPTSHNDTRDHLVGMRTPQGGTVEVARDELGRPYETVADDPGGQPVTSTATYDDLQANAMGRLAATQNQSGVVYHDYDAFGRPAVVQHDLSQAVVSGTTNIGSSYIANFDYSRQGLLKGVRFDGLPNAAKLSWRHDAYGRPTSVESADQTGPTTLVDDVTYDAFGALTHADLGNKNQVDWTYSPHRRLLRAVDHRTADGSSFGSVVYGDYDNQGNLGYETRYAGSSSMFVTEKIHEYDALDRLTPIIYGPSAAAHQHPNPIISLLNDAMHRLRGSISGFER